ncbi:MAG: DUF2357 domain-containing protein [Myxococcales bacterium]|nr:DUF2357 domain-containing protein [Myxococcales bacterium]MCB9712784.1 DUF2357 domain-containing protein [Myxococcales bacterium]
MPLTITAHGPGHSPPRTADGHHRLSAEITWLVEGDEALVAEVEAKLSPFCRRVSRSLLLRFGNSVGGHDGGPLGRVVVHSDKWDEADFEEMLGELGERMALLPFSAGNGADRDYEQGITADHRVLYHAFVYLRHLLCSSAPPEDQLVPALRLILARPHRRFERVTRWSPLPMVQRVEPRALLGMVTPHAKLTRVPRATANVLAQALHGHLPQQVEETRVRGTVDVPENRFVKAFLGKALGIVEQMRGVVAKVGRGYFRQRILADCDAMTRELQPLRRHVLWDEVSELRRVPAESQVLQRQRGYREVLRHWVRLRLTARLPLHPDTTRKLLEIKDIAELYEIWSYFEVERQVSLGLGRPPVEVGTPNVGDLGVNLGRGLRIAWEGSVELFYNLSYSRSRRDRSYSLPLRPDVVLRIPDGPNRGDHLFDAKFKVRKLDDAVQTAEDVDEAEQAAERRGMFKHADLYKMHAYRDAISNARSVWILYPGSELRFFDEVGGRVDGLEELPEVPRGVGAIPLRPGEQGDAIAQLVQRMLG